MNLGDYCRAKCGAPARYVADGFCLFVSAQDNELCLDRVGVGKGCPLLPHPNLYQLEGAKAAVYSRRGRPTKQSTGRGDR